jgi:FkbM family methyltransferase
MTLARELAAVAPLVELLGRNLTVADVGCRWGASELWSAFGSRVTVLGFDPDAEECARLARAYRGPADIRFLPVALGPAGGAATLYLTREPACSSLYPPDPEALRQRPELFCIEPVGTASIELRTLDDCTAGAGLDRIDFLKLDTQGSELDILRGAERCLGTVRALEVEVEFNEIYEGQPLFGDVDRFLRQRGFVLWRLGNLVHYGLAEARSDAVGHEVQYFDSRPVPVPVQGGQLYWAHAYFVHREMAFGQGVVDWRDGIRDACAAAALGFRDLAGWSLCKALAVAPQEVAGRIRGALED